MATEKHKLEDFRIESLPDSMYYIPDFITSEEEQHILASLPSNRWTNLTHRRLQAHPSVLSNRSVLLDSALPDWLSVPILSRFRDLGLFIDSPHKTANHVLVNEYKPGEGIMPHEDGAAYHPIVATVSLGASLVLDVYDKLSSSSSQRYPAPDFPEPQTQRTRPEPKWRILQEPRSLLITTGAAYTDLLHGIAETRVDEDLTPQTVANWSLLGDAERIVDAGSCNVRRIRTSLTYRDVLKVSKIGSRILGKPRG